MIQSTNFALFPGDELYGFVKKAMILIDEKKSSIPGIEPFLSKNQVLLENFKIGLDREARNPLIKIRAEKGLLQGNAFLSFRKYVESASTRSKQGVADAAEVIIDVLKKHGWRMNRIGQKSRFTLMEELISDLKTKHAAEVEIIGAAEQLAELEHAQQEYLEADTNVVRSESNSNEPTIGETRQPLVDGTRHLFQAINLQEVAAPSDSLNSLIASLNDLIVSSLSTIKASKTRAANAKKNAETNKETIDDTDTNATTVK